MSDTPRHRREPEPRPLLTDFTAPIPLQSRDFDAVAPMRTGPIATITTTSDELYLAHS